MVARCKDGLKPLSSHRHAILIHDDFIVAGLARVQDPNVELRLTGLGKSPGSPQRLEGRTVLARMHARSSDDLAPIRAAGTESATARFPEPIGSAAAYSGTR